MNRRSLYATAALPLLLAACSRTTSTPETSHRGRALYDLSCAACHGKDGRGRVGVASPLAASEWVLGPAARLTAVALHGVHGPIEVLGETYNLEMPAFGLVFSDEELAAVLTYVRTAWGNAAAAIDAATVTALRSRFGERDSWTAEELLTLR